MKTGTNLKFVLLALLGVCLYARGYAQEDKSAKPSADAASLIRSIDNPVSYNTGTVSVQVPLHTMQGNGVQVPIGLNYQATGIKGGQKAGVAGLGWNFSAGGKITRIMKRFPDEKSYKFREFITLYNPEKGPGDPGYLKIELREFFQSWRDFSEYTKPDTLEKDCILSYVNTRGIERDGVEMSYLDSDTEADIFYFEIPGGGGTFFLDHSTTNEMTGYCMPYQDIDIKLSGGGLFNDDDNNNGSSFTITDSNGTVYTFGNTPESREITNVDYPESGFIDHAGYPELTYVSTWWLTSIKPLSGEVVNFEYANGPKQEHVSEMSAHYDDKSDEDAKYMKWTGGKDTLTVTPKYLSKINLGRDSITFTHSNRLLTDIEVHSPLCAMPVKHIRLGYGGDSDFLTSVSQIFGETAADEGYTENLYLFDYYSGIGAMNTSTQNDVDYWGFNNGISNSGWPKAVMHNYPKMDVTTIVDETPSFAFNSHRANIKAAVGGTLMSIENGSGGKTIYEYELHDASNLMTEFTDGSNKVGGLRIKSILQESGGKVDTLKKYEYRLANGTTSGRVFSPEILTYEITLQTVPRNLFGTKKVYTYVIYQSPLNNLYDPSGKHIYYERVREISPDGSSTVYDYGVPQVNTQYKGHGEYGKTDTTDRYSVWRHGLMAPKTQRPWRNGLLKSQTMYDAAGNIVGRTTNYYNTDINTNNYEDNTDVRKRVTCYTPISYHGQGIYMYDLISECVKLEKTVTSRGRYNQASTTEYEYNDLMLPVRVKVTDDSGAVTETSVKYSGDYKAPSSGRHPNTSMVYVMKKIDELGLRGVPIETIQTRNGSILGGEISTYRVLNESVVPASKYVLALREPMSRYGFAYSRLNEATGVLEMDSRYVPVEHVDEYGAYYNIDSVYYHVPLTTHKEHGLSNAMIYDPDNRVPIAIVENAVHSQSARANEVFHTSFEYDPQATSMADAKTGDRAMKGPFTPDFSKLKSGQYILSYWTKAAGGTEWTYRYESVVSDGRTTVITVGTANEYIDEVRIMPADATMVTFTYHPVHGKTSETDINGRTTYYRYNVFGLLKEVLDNERTVMKSYAYDNYGLNTVNE